MTSRFWSRPTRATTSSRVSRPWWIPVAGMAVALFVLSLYVLQPTPLRHLDLNVHDAFHRSLPQTRPSSIPVLVDIDEESLAALGQWPWPRYRLAAVVDRLGQAGAAAIAVDILLAEPDRTSPSLLRKRLREDFGLDVSFQGLPPELEDHDRILTHVLHNNPVVLGCYFRFDEAVPPPRRWPQGPGIAEFIPEHGRPALDSLPTARSASLPLPALTAVAPTGFYNIRSDSDGLLRRAPLLLAANGTLYAGLAVRALMLAQGQSTLRVFTDADGVSALGLGNQTVPLEPDGSMAIRFHGRAGQFQTLSARHVLAGGLPAGSLAGRVAVIGTSATGLGDIRSTPFDRHYPGMEVHAAVIDTILSGRFLVTPAWAPGAQSLAILGTGVLCVLAFGRAGAAVYLPTGAGLLLGLWHGGRLLSCAGIFLSPLYSMLTVGAEALILIGLRFWHEEGRRRAIHRAFSRYVSPEIVNRIIQHHRGPAALAGEQRVLSLLFSDIRGFTTLSERLRPEQTVELLNRYFTPMTSIVRNSQGTLDKFIGDALMAFWNAPLDVADHAERAVRAALDMQDALHALNTELSRDLDLRLAMGTGIHTGPAYVGNMGTGELLAYTAIGDTVNLASRLEGLCPVYGTPNVVSDATRALCLAHFSWQRLDRVRVKGKGQAVTIYTAMRPAESAERDDELRRHHQALACYDAGRFEDALAAFSALERDRPSALYTLYVTRCTTLRHAPPSNWDGVWTLSAK